MGKAGRLYSPEFKEEAIRLVHSSEERSLKSWMASRIFCCPHRR
jgi:transposase-like protein